MTTILNKITAAITGVGAWVPDYVLDNKELEKLVDTSDDWIRERTGILERRILKEPGKGTSELGANAVKNLLAKTNTDASEIELLLCATVTPDHQFPATANIIADKIGARGIPSFDVGAACSGFLFALTTAAKYIETGMYKKVVVVGADKMSSIVDYTDRTTCIIFGDGGGAVMLEPTTEKFGILDSVMYSDGDGMKHLHQKAGGSVHPATIETVQNREHFIHQEGKAVFKFAVTNMAAVSEEVMQRNQLESDDVAWLVAHQANKRIIDATARRMGVGSEKVMMNIQRYGNTTAGTIPLLLSDYEKQLKKGDNLILSAFGGGFTWASIYVKWAY